ncbi:hypothetical protein KKG24_03325 [Patescibacteria group bacterium]|nr:hypothetical protein [Patescibacteria group bacterium]
MIKENFKPLRVVVLRGGVEKNNLLFGMRIQLDRRLEEFGIVFSGIAPEITVVVKKLVEKGNLLDILGHTANDLERRRLMGSQFLDYLMFHFYGHRTLTVLTKNNEEVATNLSNVFIVEAERFQENKIFVSPLLLKDRVSVGPHFIFP